MNASLPKVAVLGAGNGGFAASADLTLRGFSVSLFELPAFKQNIGPVLTNGEIGVATLPSTRLAGGFPHLDFVTTDIAEAVYERDINLVIVPAFAHQEFAKLLAPVLQEGQHVVLMPGNFGGTIVFRKTLDEIGFKKDVVIGETACMPYACRKLDEHSIFIRGYKHGLEYSAFPSTDTLKGFDLLKLLYPEIRAVPNVMITGLSNLNTISHPAGMITNVGSIDRKEDLLFQHEAFSASANHLAHALDRERMEVGKAAGLDLEPMTEITRRYYGYQGARGETFIELKHSNPIYAWSKTPTTLRHRYLEEDIPYGLVPLEELGKQFRVDASVTSAVITLADIYTGKDFRREGRHLSDIGIEGMDQVALKEFLERR